MIILWALLIVSGIYDMFVGNGDHALIMFALAAIIHYHETKDE